MLDKIGLTKEPVAQGVEAQEHNVSTLLTIPGSELAGHVKDAWQTNRRHKLTIQSRLIDCLRARKGVYSDQQRAEIESQGGAKPIYMKLTGTKCRAASSWVRDILLPAGERPFSVSPTSIADLPDELDNAIREKAKQEATALIRNGDMDGDVMAALDFIDRTRENALIATNDKAKARALKMERKIADYMDEGNWDSAFEEFIEDFVTYPTAFIKGPYVRKTRTLKWGKGYTAEPTDEIGLAWRRISPFDLYPGPFARNLQDGDMIERLRLTQAQLYEMIGVQGYDEDRIRQVLQDYNTGGLRQWIWEDFERERLESDTSFIIDNDDTIDVLHYWGKVKGSVLKDWGHKQKDLDPDKMYEVDCMLIGDVVVRAVLNDDPLGKRPYHHACWDSVPGSLWGVALPEQMEDHQSMVNACARALASNMALASGPQVAVLTDMLAEGESVGTMRPFKIWQMKSSMTGNSGKPIEFFQPDSNADQLMKVMEQFNNWSDDVTNVPRYSYGNENITGAGATATGLSMLMNSAAKGIRRAIANIDAYVIRPTVYQTFVHIMLHDEDDSIKGDCKIVPRGAAALLIKEQNLTRLQTFLAQTANPLDTQIINMKRRAKILREVARIMDLPTDVVPTDEELERAEQEAAVAQQQQAMLEADPTLAGGTPPTPPSPNGGDQSININNAATQTAAGI